MFMYSQDFGGWMPRDYYANANGAGGLLWSTSTDTDEWGYYFNLGVMVRAKYLGNGKLPEILFCPSFSRARSGWYSYQGMKPKWEVAGQACSCSYYMLPCVIDSPIGNWGCCWNMRDAEKYKRAIAVERSAFESSYAGFRHLDGYTVFNALFFDGGVKSITDAGMKALPATYGAVGLTTYRTAWRWIHAQGGYTPSFSY